ncbi:uncharacterized protein LOC106462912, partial [Limulus polyphemus]|uniref:Uncharacterized protein LOC106462912 n=1 Tax=Limulus polyphemus TaxID=6850 RepID=A0ABM1SQW9_LIMPO
MEGLYSDSNMLEVCVNPENLLAGLYSDSNILDVCVNPENLLAGLYSASLYSDSNILDVCVNPENIIAGLYSDSNILDVCVNPENILAGLYSDSNILDVCVNPENIIAGSKSFSNPEDLNVYEYESEEADHNMEVNDTLRRVKMEDVGDPEVLAKLQRQEHEEREEIERELRVHNERIQRETAAAIKRQAREAASFMRVRTTPTSLVTSSASNLSSPPPAFPVFTPQLHSRLLPTTTPPCSSPGSSASQSSPSPSINSIAASTGRQTPGQDPSKYSFEEQFRQKSFNGGTSSSRSDKDKNSEALGVASLYELNDDPQRKEFLDDLFQFMQKR